MSDMFKRAQAGLAQLLCFSALSAHGPYIRVFPETMRLLIVGRAIQNIRERIIPAGPGGSSGRRDGIGLCAHRRLIPVFLLQKKVRGYVWREYARLVFGRLVAASIQQAQLFGILAEKHAEPLAKIGSG